MQGESPNWVKLSEEYVEKGLSVIPLIGKAPRSSGWSKWCTEKMDMEDITLLPGQTGIGLCLGPASGIVAVDIDTDNKTILDMVPDSPVKKRGQKGETRFFQYDKSIRSQKPGMGIEILAQGNQTVLPPSIHPITREPYYWIGTSLLDFDLDHLPSLDLSFLSKFEVQKKGRHDTLVGMGFAALNKGKDIDTVVEELFSYDMRAHDPPWVMDDLKARSETEAKIKLKGFVLGLQRTKNNKEAINLGDSPKKEKVSFTYKKCPELTGILKEIYDYICETSYTDVHNLNTGAALSIFSVVCAHQYEFMDTKPNIYALLLADSGAGKSFGTRAAMDLLAPINDGRHVDSADYLSSQAITSRIYDYCAQLHVSDEFSKTMKLASGGGFQASIFQQLCSIWSASTGFFMSPSVKKGEEATKTMIKSPFLSILTSTTIEEFKGNASKDIFTSGLLPRFIIFSEGKKSEARFSLDRPKVSIMRESLSKKLRSIHNDVRTNNITGEVEPKQITLTSGGEVYMREVFDRYQKKIVENNDPITSAMNSRLKEQLKKIAILICVSEGKIHVNEDHLSLANGILETCLYNSYPCFAESGAENPYHKAKERIFNLIKENPGFSKSQIAIKLRSYSARLRTEILSDLIDSGLIELESGRLHNGKEVTIYYAIKTDTQVSVGD